MAFRSRESELPGKVVDLKRRLEAIAAVERAMQDYVMSGGGLPVPVVCLRCPARARPRPLRASARRKLAA